MTDPSPTPIQDLVSEFLGGYQTIALAYGSSFDGADITTRAFHTAQIAMLAIVCQTLIEKGVITNDDLVAVFNQALAEAWSQLPI